MCAKTVTFPPESYCILCEPNT